MASLNKVTLIGHLGKDPETRYSPSGDAICNITVATSESWKDKQTGEKKEVTEWHRVVLFGRLAEVASQYLAKGSLIYVEGRLQTRKWQDKDGQDRYTTEIRGDELKMLSAAKEGTASKQNANPPAARPAAKPQQKSEPPDLSDDIPF